MSFGKFQCKARTAAHPRRALTSTVPCSSAWFCLLKRFRPSGEDLLNVTAPLLGHEIWVALAKSFEENMQNLQLAQPFSSLS